MLHKEEDQELICSKAQRSCSILLAQCPFSSSTRLLKSMSNGLAKRNTEVSQRRMILHQLCICLFHSHSLFPGNLTELGCPGWDEEMHGKHCCRWGTKQSQSYMQAQTSSSQHCGLQPSAVLYFLVHGVNQTVSDPKLQLWSLMKQRFCSCWEAIQPELVGTWVWEEGNSPYTYPRRVP